MFELPAQIYFSEVLGVRSLIFPVSPLKPYLILTTIDLAPMEIKMLENILTALRWKPNNYQIERVHPLQSDGVFPDLFKMIFSFGIPVANQNNAKSFPSLVDLNQDPSLKKAVWDQLKTFASSN